MTLLTFVDDRFIYATLLSYICGNVFLGMGVNMVDAVSVEKDLTITLSEKLALEKFKSRVLPILPHSYMKQDIYLMRWLRAKNLNLDAAEQMLKSNLRWRQEQKMDTINNEDWSDMLVDYPSTNDTVDKDGRKIGAVNLGVWDIRVMALAGKMPRLQRYIVKLLEEGLQEVVKKQRYGQNVTQFVILINLDGFNLIQHACPLCLPLYVNFLNAYEQHYPGHMDKTIYINTPPIFDVVLSVLSPLASSATLEAAVFLGPDKQEWMRYLDKVIDKSQRRNEYGGTMTD